MSNSFREIESQLIELPLYFEPQKYVDIFKSKNNKTLKETINSKKYTFLAQSIMEKYPQDLDMNLGDFLLQLKNSGDDFYKKFLNKYGDLEYSIFSLKDEKHNTLKGVYFYFLDGDLKYIGRCKDSMQKRVNSGYGKISPKNCYLDGQSTNCKVNALITKHQKDIILKLFVMNDNKMIEKLESRLICEIEPVWNGRK